MSQSEETRDSRAGVLMLTYAYAPYGTGGTFRGMRFTKYLPNYGWDPLVVTIPEKSVPESHLDESLQKCIPEGITIRRVAPLHPFASLVSALKNVVSFALGRRQKRQASSPKPGRSRNGNRQDVEPPWFARKLREVHELLFVTPDRNTAWILPALAAALPLVRRYRPRAVYSTGPPHSSHLIAVVLKWLTGLPVVIDFRDPWAAVDWGVIRGGKLGQRLNRWLERLCIRNADRIVLNTATVLEDILSRHKDQPESKFLVITNGYDPEPPIDRRQAERVHRPHADDGTIRLCHPGLIYGQRDLRPMIDAVRQLRDSGVPVRFEQIGPVADAPGIQAYIDAAGLQDAVVLTPRQPYVEALRRMAETDVFVLFQQGTKKQIPGKIYEMLPFGRPILAFTEPDGITARIIGDYQLGQVVPSSDPETVASAIRDLVRRDISAGDTDAWRNAMVEFDGRRLTGKLATVLDEITGVVEGVSTRAVAATGSSE